MLYQRELIGNKNIGKETSHKYWLVFCVVMEIKEEKPIGISVEEARKMLGIGRNLMLQLVKLDGFPAIRFKKKIIVNKELLPKWFAENCGEYGKYHY